MSWPPSAYVGHVKGMRLALVASVVLGAACAAAPATSPPATAPPANPTTIEGLNRRG